MQLSKQAVGAIMLALQKSMMAVLNEGPVEEYDVTNILLNFDLDLDTEQGLIVTNPPLIDTEVLFESTDKFSSNNGPKAGIKAPPNVEYEVKDGMMFPKV